MENKTITTTSEYSVTLRPFLTYDQYIEIQKLWMRDVLIDTDRKDEKGTPKAPSMGKIPATVMYEANKLAVSFLIVKILDPNGAEVTRQDNELPIPPADGAEVMEEVTRISNEAATAFDKKKATA
jgi:hypothetical protein